jgi:hypothetical protein
MDLDFLLDAHRGLRSAAFGQGVLVSSPTEKACSGDECSACPFYGYVVVASSCRRSL